MWVMESSSGVGKLPTMWQKLISRNDIGINELEILPIYWVDWIIGLEYQTDALKMIFAQSNEHKIPQ